RDATAAIGQHLGECQTDVQLVINHQDAGHGVPPLESPLRSACSAIGGRDGAYALVRTNARKLGKRCGVLGEELRASGVRGPLLMAHAELVAPALELRPLTRAAGAVKKPRDRRKSLGVRPTTFRKRAANADGV